MKRDTKNLAKLVIFSIIAVGLIAFIVAWPFLLHARNGGDLSSFIALIVNNWWLYALAILVAGVISYYRLRR